MNPFRLFFALPTGHFSSQHRALGREKYRKTFARTTFWIDPDTSRPINVDVDPWSLVKNEIYIKSIDYKPNLGIYDQLLSHIYSNYSMYIGRYNML